MTMYLGMYDFMSLSTHVHMHTYSLTHSNMHVWVHTHLIGMEDCVVQMKWLGKRNIFYFVFKEE